MSLDDPNRRLNQLGWWLHGLGLSAALAIAVAGQLVVLHPIDHRAAASVRRATELEKGLQEASRVRAEHARLTDELATARQQAAELTRRIPDEPREADFLAELAHLADDVGLEIQDYRPGLIVSRGSYCVIQVDLIGEGDYPSICNFVHQLPDLPRCSTVTHLRIQSDDRRDAYLVTMSLQLYFGAKPAAGAQEKSHA